MAKLSKASEYVVRWRARGHPAGWIARQVFGLVRSNWRRWKVDDYLLSPEEARLFAIVEACEKEKRSEQGRERVGLHNERLERVEAVERTPTFLERRAKLAERAEMRKTSAAFSEAANRATVGAINRSTSRH